MDGKIARSIKWVILATFALLYFAGDFRPRQGHVRARGAGVGYWVLT